MSQTDDSAANLLGQLNEPDGHDYKRFIAEYMNAIEGYWQQHPTFRAAGYNIVLTSDRRNTWEAVKSLFGWVTQCCRGYKVNDAELPRCDVLIYCSTRKPNVQPACDHLAERLAKRGLRCAVASAKYMACWMPDDAGKPSPQVIKAYEQLLRWKLSWWGAFVLLFRSFWAALLLIYVAWRGRAHVWRGLLGNFVGVWHQLAASGYREVVAARLLKRLQPRVLVSNGEHLAIGAELLMSPLARLAHRVWFFNEYPMPDMIPRLINEIWVWNQQSVDSFLSFLPSDSDITVSVVGRPEIDYVLKRPPTRNDEVEPVAQLAGSRKVLLYLSEYIGPGIYEHGNFTRQGFTWLAHAARRCPDWCFILKSRYGFHVGKVPGVEDVQGIENIIVEPREITLSDYVRWDRVKAVTAQSSSGLLVAAGLGKAALRLLVTTQPTVIPVLDQACIPITSAEGLVEALRRLDTSAPLPASVHARCFPYPGSALDRMEQRCLLHFSSQGQATVNVPERLSA